MKIWIGMIEYRSDPGSICKEIAMVYAINWEDAVEFAKIEFFSKYKDAEIINIYLNELQEAYE